MCYGALKNFYNSQFFDFVKYFPISDTLLFKKITSVNNRERYSPDP